MAPKSKPLKTFYFSLAHHSQPEIESSNPYTKYVKSIDINKLKKENRETENVEIGAKPG